MVNLTVELSFTFQFHKKFLLLSLLFWETETSYCEYTIDEKLRIRTVYIFYFSLLMV